jgi:hypothetical protein
MISIDIQMMSFDIQISDILGVVISIDIQMISLDIQISDSLDVLKHIQSQRCSAAYVCAHDS